MPQERVIIVGAGLHGLIAAKTYLQLDPSVDLTIIEGGKTVGGVWSDERLYPELFAQVTHGFFEFTDLPMEKKYLSPHGYISGIALNKYVAKFAEKFDLMKYIRFKTWVKLVEERPGGRWAVRVRYKDYSGPSAFSCQNTFDEGIDVEETMECDKLIMATGTANEPEIPNIPQFNFHRPIKHSQEMLEYSAALESSSIERVTVIGAAKAAYDAVYLAMKAGKKVDWVIRPNGRGPLSVYPATMFGINSMNVGFCQLFSKFCPTIDSTGDWWHWALHTTCIGVLLTRLFWIVATLICNAYAGYSRSENAEKLRPMPNSVFWCNAGCGLISNPHMWELFHNSKLATVHRQNIASFTEDSVILEGSRGTNIPLRTDFVLLCTGWKDNLSSFRPESWTRLGLPYFDQNDASFVEEWDRLDRNADSEVDRLFPILSKQPKTAAPLIPNRNVWRQYRRMVPPDIAGEGKNSIVFLGQIYIMQTMLHAEVQALWAVAYLLGRIDVPDLLTMRREVAAWNSWTRKRYLHRGNTMPYAIYDQKACCDRLLKDLGINTRRKDNNFLELFSPYGPRDYVGLVREFEQSGMNRSQQIDKSPVAQEHHHPEPQNFAHLIFGLSPLLLFSWLVLGFYTYESII